MLQYRGHAFAAADAAVEAALDLLDEHVDLDPPVGTLRSLGTSLGFGGAVVDVDFDIGP
jgi:hypothetical protein